MGAVVATVAMSILPALPAAATSAPSAALPAGDRMFTFAVRDDGLHLYSIDRYSGHASVAGPALDLDAVFPSDANVWVPSAAYDATTGDAYAIVLAEEGPEIPQSYLAHVDLRTGVISLVDEFVFDPSGDD